MTEDRTNPLDPRYSNWLVDHTGTPLVPVEVCLTTEEIREGLAFHEAGHAIVCMVSGVHVTRTGIVTWQDESGATKTTGNTSWIADSSLVPFFDLAAVCAAGAIAQMRHLRERGRLAADTARAAEAEHDREYAISLLAQGGLSLVPDQALAGQVSWREVCEITERRVEVFWPQISAVATALVGRELTGDEAAEIAGMTNPRGAPA